MKDLVWELFLFVRELMPPSEGNSKRQQEWAARFHELEVAADWHEPVDVADHDVNDDEPDDDLPHVRAAPKRKKR